MQTEPDSVHLEELGEQIAKQLGSPKAMERMIGHTVTATATEMQNNFGRYLALVQGGGEVIVTKNGKEVGRFIPRRAAVSSLPQKRIAVIL